ncbi:hypothetical protein PCANC_23222 [Puccinia coronata f. sp. avenae]|uniref:FCP1 homology domain-containing protein n=1 Tax=Puccinia coronata f. sp. avenae TaxID=200324 RepID=A0A2N5TNW7_9BASI|nr:hypothetical protein PCANC_23222 [Puccinia coronata f. sp. avenae]
MPTRSKSDLVHPPTDPEAIIRAANAKRRRLANTNAPDTMSAAAAEKVPGTVADTAPDSTDDATVAVSEVAKDLATEEALKELFQGADTVPDSALDGYYNIKDMPAFEKWITDRKSTLCNPALAQDTPKQKILVLDLDNTLICRDSYSSDSFRVSGTSPSTYNIQLHHDCLTFLHEKSAHYHQLVIFTSSSYVNYETLPKGLSGFN